MKPKNIKKENVFYKNNFLEKYSKFWLTELANFQIGDFDNYLTFLKENNYLKGKTSTSNKRSISYIKITLSKKASANYNEDNIQNLFITSCLVLLYKINNYNPTSIWLMHDEKNIIKESSEHPLSKYLPLNANFKPEMSLHEALIGIKKKFDYIKIKKTFLLESWYDNIEFIEKSQKAYIRIDRDFSVLNFDKRFTVGFLISTNQKSLYVCFNSNSIQAKNLPFLSYLKKIISLISHDHKKFLSISRFPLAYKKEDKIILNQCTSKKILHKSSKNIPVIFKEIVKKHPSKKALKFETQAITYKKLDIVSNKFANYLYKKGLRRGDFVCILIDRGIETIISIIAILKAGGAYVPIDIKYPNNRIQYIVDNSRSKFIISKKLILNEKLSFIVNNNISIVDIDSEHNLINKETSSFRLDKTNYNDLAYLIYTSGSTGNPKGVYISHKNVINYATWFNKSFKLNKKTCIDFSSSISFDISVACTLVPLMFGSSVAICTDETKLDPYEYIAHLKANHVTHIECTPDYFNQMLSFPKEIKNFSSLKWVLLGADAVIKKDIENYLKLVPTSYVVNEYGPTECTVAITAYIVTSKNLNQYNQIIPIGKPAFNTQVYVLDDFLNICPIGVTGELYIAGDSVSAGYNDTSLTELSFIQNPFKSNSFMYKTGDFVRFLPDGNLEFLGRRDDQIKIRGYRIETREIEDSLLKNSAIMQCKVLSKKKSNHEKSLVAFLVPYDKVKQLSAFEIRKFLQRFVPEYMIPSEYIWINKFPTNNSGKVDIKLLYNNSSQSNIFDNKSNNIKFKNNITKKIFEIWCEIFDTKEIEPDDDFFDLGGNSLLAIKLLTKLNTTFNLRLKTQCILNSPTINKLSSTIQYLKKNIRSTHTCNNRNITKEPELICLQSFGRKDFNLFLIHPVGGTIYLFKKLAKLLGKNHPIYALQDPGIENPSIRFKNIQEMANYYLYVIQKVQQKGPYCIAGASFGATLAVEIANQLNLLGEKVNFIGLLDGWALHSKLLADEKYFQNLMKSKVLNFDKKYANSLLKMQFSREKMLFNYKIPSFNEKIYLFKAIELWDVFKLIDSPYNGWENYLAKEIETYHIPGDHESIFFEPNVNTLAKYLRICLDRHQN